MSKKTLEDVRSTFKNFFESNSHQVIESSPLVPQNDSTLMFANSGMVQFKNVFTGLDKRSYKRATTAQKCVRAGGKHNDLENVGFTPRHHTFFEMLGNFSFGDYFKEQAIKYAWDLITKEFGLSKDKLYMTVFSEDQESFDLWKKISGFSDDRIIKIATTDNFWSMGDTGPCGPCSEIFYDHGDHLWGGLPGTKDQDGDRFIEIWNLVFMQFEQLAKNKRISLPKPSVDTGMGLERMTAVMQGTHDNYKIDLFQKIISNSEDLFQTKASNENIASFRVIADHLRATAFLISDGVTPSNEGRGYVLRRIMRRAMRHCNTLGKANPILYKIVPKVIELMKNEYPQLDNAKDLIIQTISTEEEKFSLLLKNGLKILNEEVMNIKNNILPGSVAFKLYDTYGFPVDLTQDVLKEKKIIIDQNEFELLSEQRKQEARSSWKGSGSSGLDKIWFKVKEKTGPTEFYGYTSDSIDAKILCIVKEENIVDEINADEEGYLILNQTVFYAESGGQIGDVGEISNTNSLFEVMNTQKIFGDLFVHFGKLSKGSLKVEDNLSLIINKERREKIKAYHSATHLLHAALREKLGKHVSQKGSYVGPDRLRFDFSHPNQIEKKDLIEINQIVNDVIEEGGVVTTTIMTPDKAIKLGAMALFGEKYGDEVRVVQMGKRDNKVFSLELCGGTHVDNLSKINKFEIISEGSIASGVRRIEALRGEELDMYQQEIKRKNQELLQSQNEEIKLLKNKILNLDKNYVFKNFKNVEEEILNLKENFSKIEKDYILNDPTKNIISDYQKSDFLIRTQIIHGISSKEIRGLIDDNKKILKSSVVIILGIENQKITVAIGVSKNLVEKFNAIDVLKNLLTLLGGKGGGGRPDFAMGGAQEISKIDDAIKQVVSILN